MQRWIMYFLTDPPRGLGDTLDWIWKNRKDAVICFCLRALGRNSSYLYMTIEESLQASMVGHKYGVLWWSKTGRKTIEGTAAGITSVLAACSILIPILATTGSIFTQHWLTLLIAVTLSGLLEAYTALLDNAFIPLVFYSLLCI